MPAGMDRRQTTRSAAAAASPSLPLPDDATVEILSRVPAKSLCRFKCVSKGWRDLISERLLQLPQTLEGFFYADDVVRGGGSDDGRGKEEACLDLQWRFINTSGGSSPLVDSSFSYLFKRLPRTESIGLMESCNGLLLFGHKRDSDMYDSLGYIVCNPATEQWMSVPSSGWTPFLDESEDEDSDAEPEPEPAGFAVTFFIFDPAVSPHFHLVQLGIDFDLDFDTCSTYSSETGVWSKGASEWSEDDGLISLEASAFVCGMLHLSITKAPEPFHSSLGTRQELIVVDAEGRKRRTMSSPENCLVLFFLDYDAEEWVLKHRVSFPRLFGRTSCQILSDYRVAAIHPDRNVVFYLQHWDQKLKSYDMDSKEVCTLRTLGLGARKIVAYVPYFAEPAAFASKHRNCPL